MIQEER